MTLESGLLLERYHGHRATGMILSFGLDCTASLYHDHCVKETETTCERSSVRIYHLLEAEGTMLTRRETIVAGHVERC